MNKTFKTKNLQFFINSINLFIILVILFQLFYQYISYKSAYKRAYENEMIKITNIINIVKENTIFNEEKINRLKTMNEEEIKKSDIYKEFDKSSSSMYESESSHIKNIEIGYFKNDKYDKLLYNKPEDYIENDLSYKFYSMYQNKDVVIYENNIITVYTNIKDNLNNNMAVLKLSINDDILVTTKTYSLYITIISSIFIILVGATTIFLLFVISSNMKYKDYKSGAYKLHYFKSILKKKLNKKEFKKGFFVMIKFTNLSMMQNLYDFETISKIEKILLERINNIFRNKKTLATIYANDVLGIYISNVTSVLEIDSILKDAKEILSSAIDIDLRLFEASILISVVIHEKNINSIDDLVINGEKTLNYYSKNYTMYYLNDYLIYDEEKIKEDNEEYLKKVTDIIDNEMIFNVFQPIVNNKTKEIIGYEALTRVKSKDINIVSLIEFAGQFNLTSKLEKLLVKKIGERVSKEKEKLKGKYMFINSSSKVEYSEDELKQIQSDFKNCILVCEVTEYDKIDMKEIIRKTDRIKKYNIKVALDDYGTGYSNEVVLLNLKPDILKIDRELISNIDRDKNKYVIVSNLVKYCSNNGIIVLAEGVETKAEFEVIADLGIDLTQGFYFSRPSENIIYKL